MQGVVPLRGRLPGGSRTCHPVNCQLGFWMLGPRAGGVPRRLLLATERRIRYKMPRVRGCKLRKLYIEKYYSFG